MWAHILNMYKLGYVQHVFYGKVYAKEHVML